MKVLYIASGDSKYGAAHSLLELILSMKKIYGIEPVLLTRKRNQVNELCDTLGIENYVFWNRDIMAGSAYSNPCLNMIKHIVKYGLYVYGGFTMHKIDKIGLDFSTVDLIHTNLNRNDIGAYISRRYKIPHIWHLRELGREDYRVRFYKRNCIDYLNHNADAYIAISKCVEQAWIERGIQQEKIKIVYNGIDLSQFVEKKVQKRDKIKIIMTGHIQFTKGQDQLVRAIACLNREAHSKIQVDFFGEAYPDYQKKLNRLVTKYDLEKVIHFCGYCDHIPEKLSEYDIGIICSRAEGFGRVTVEYMAAGLAVIASNTGANPELIQDGENGLLYQYDNPKELADKIEYLMDNPEHYERIARAGQKCVREQYTTEKNVEGIYRVYQQCVDTDRER